MLRAHRNISLVLLIVVVLSLLPVAPVEALPCLPRIYFTQIPRYNTQQNLMGYVRCIDPTKFRIATYIDVDDPRNWSDGWWVKPTWRQPTVRIKPDGTFLVDVTTGGVDPLALQIAIFVVPKDFTPQLYSSKNPLPIADLCLVTPAARLIWRPARGRSYVFRICPPTTPLPSASIH